MKSFNAIKHSLAGLAMLGFTAIAPAHADTPNHMDNRNDPANELKNASQGTSDSYEADKKANAKAKQIKHGNKKQAEVRNDKDDLTNIPGPK